MQSFKFLDVVVLVSSVLTIFDDNSAEENQRAVKLLIIKANMSQLSNNSSNYFKDGKTVIDFVIVIDKTEQNNPDKYKLVEQYLHNLEQLGLILETDFGNIPDNVYIKISLPEKLANTIATNYGLDIQNSGHLLLPTKYDNGLKLFRTPLHNRDRFVRKQGTTSAERILLINEILTDTRFGDNNEMKDIKTLVDLKVIKTAYPLHEYDPIWEHTETVDDRKKLIEYWANFRMWYKEQPLNLIEKYFGTEIAFYFAFSGFFNKILIPSSILGVTCFLINFIILSNAMFKFDYNRFVQETCGSDQRMCPICTRIFGCVTERLSAYCNHIIIAFFFDNSRTIAFAVMISFWATIFVNLWTRYEHILRIRWNVNTKVTTKIRDAYKSKAKNLRLSPITGELEAFIPTHLKLFYLTLTYSACLFLISLVFLACVFVIFCRLIFGVLLPKFVYKEITVLVMSVCVQVILIRFFRLGYNKWALWLTKLENPRTQQEFDNSVLYKFYLLSFVNNYSSLFYIAFLKGRFYSPGYIPEFINLKTDICAPTGCLVALCIQLSFLMLFKHLIGNIILLIKLQFMKGRQTKHARIDPGPQFEEEFKLLPTDCYTISAYFIHLITQYGFVTFFVGAFPFAPLFALLDNILELRITAYKLTMWQRRPIPKKAAGIGLWTNILQRMTYMSTVSNAFVVGFTSDFVIRLIYVTQVDSSLKGYINSTLSIYDMHDFPGNYSGNYRYCYYRANRYPPDHPHKYQLNDFYWYEFGMRLLAVLIFEHVIAIFNAILSYIIPDVPQTVKESLQQEKNKLRDIRLKQLKPKYDEIRRNLDKTTIEIRRRTLEEITPL